MQEREWEWVCTHTREWLTTFDDILLAPITFRYNVQIEKFKRQKKSAYTWCPYSINLDRKQTDLFSWQMVSENQDVFHSHGVMLMIEAGKQLGTKILKPWAVTTKRNRMMTHMNLILSRRDFKWLTHSRSSSRLW